MESGQVVLLIEDATQSVPGTIDPTTVLDCQVWDSMSMVAFMARVEEELGVELTADDMAACRTPNELAAAITEKAVR
jgi:acyl carrier protein